VSNILIEHLDFVFLVYGLIFFLFAITAGFMGLKRGNNTCWRWLCAFGVIHGLAEWTDMLIPLMGRQPWYFVLRAILLAGSFTSLFEFGRRTVIWHGKGKAGFWIYGPIVLLILFQARMFPEDFLALVRWNLGVPAGLLAALALWQLGAPQRDKNLQWMYVVGPISLGLYSLSAGIVVSPAHFWPADHFNEQWFLNTTGIPIQIIRTLLAGIAALTLWCDYTNWRTQSYSADFARRVRYVRWTLFIAISVVVVGGWFLVERADLQTRQDHMRRLIGLSRGVAAVFNPGEIRVLRAENGDPQMPLYLNLKMKCQRICEVDSSIRYVYVMTRSGENIVFLMDVEPERFRSVVDRVNAVPGEIYDNPPPEIMEVFKTREAVGAKPYRDFWGMFVSGYAPILDYDGNVMAVVGIDERWSEWLYDITCARLVRIVLIGCTILLLLFFAVLWRREIDGAQIRNASSERVQIQQSALLRIANSASVAEGNVFVMARSVTQEIAGVIGVEQAELWIKDKESEKFRTEDVFSAHFNTHTSGQFSGVGEGDAFLKMLEVGRITLSTNVQEDPRFTGILEDLGWQARAVLVSPLRVSGRLAGWVMAVQTSRCRNWLLDEMRFVSEMADQVTHTMINNDRRLAEEALQKANNELELRVQERTAALAKKNEELSREITERLRIEEEQRSLQNKMQQAQKLESLGLMAGGIAHDFNNILMAVLGNVELARLKTPEDSPVYEYLQDIESASCRAAELARQMLIYSGRSHASVQEIDLNAMIQDMTRILKVSLGENTRIQYDLEQELPHVDGDLTQLRQVLMNLVINASEAIGKQSGSISLGTGVIHYDKAMFETMWLKENLPDGKYVFMDVSDTGCGMDELTVKRIFDPFFTTKFTGRGLGLAAVLGIIKGHNGAIDVVSHVGKGTRFRVIFPVGRRDLDPGKNISKAVGKGG